MQIMDYSETQRALTPRPSSRKSSHQRLSAMDAMVESIDGRTSGRRSSSQSIHSGFQSIIPSMLRKTLFGTNVRHTTVLLEEVGQTGDEDEDDAATSEAAKTMTLTSGIVLLCKSMLGGGASTSSRSFIFVRLSLLTLPPQECSLWHTEAHNSASY
jgi:hypothetical protein